MVEVACYFGVPKADLGETYLRGGWKIAWLDLLLDGCVWLSAGAQDVLTSSLTENFVVFIQRAMLGHGIEGENQLIELPTGIAFLL